MEGRMNFSNFSRGLFALSLFASFSSQGLASKQIGFDPTQQSPKPRTVTLNFTDSEKKFVAGVSDYSLSQSDSINFKSGVEYIPDLKDLKGYLLSGWNRSDNLFLFIKTKCSGFEPNTVYNVVFKEVSFATNVPAGTLGTGGSPGESVYVKAGASLIEPISELRDDKSYRMNIDVGQQANDGKDAVVLGNFAKVSGNTTEKYEMKNVPKPGSKKNVLSKSDSNGNMWLLVGTDSGFESTTSIYFKSAIFEFMKN